MGQNVFSSWDGTDTYVWEHNHQSPDGEEAIGQTRNLTRDAATGATIGGGVIQQGDDGPMEIKLKGKIWTQNQYERMWDFWNRSRTETIMFTDFTGAAYEVMFTDFQPQRVGTLHNKHDASMSDYYYQYTLTLTIITIFSGPLYGRIFQFG